MKTKLSGENRISDFRSVARELTSKISSREGVVGIAFIGGLERGFADKYSDLDVIVLVAGKHEQLRRQLYESSSRLASKFGVDIDMEVHDVEDFKRQAWDENDRWEFSKTKIVFDPDRVVEKVIKKKLKVPKDYWTSRIVEFAEYLTWYCCPPKQSTGTVAESWISRGDLLSAHYCLSYSVDLLLKVIFALNREHLPVPKWRLFYSCSLKWLPKDYRRLIRDAMKTSEFSVEDLNLRLEAMRKLWQWTLPKIEDETGLTLDKLSAYFVEKILRIQVPQI